MDLTKGYWPIPVAREDVRMTAFVTPDGQYKFLTLRARYSVILHFCNLDFSDYWGLYRGKHLKVVRKSRPENISQVTSNQTDLCRSTLHNPADDNIPRRLKIVTRGDQQAAAITRFPHHKTSNPQMKNTTKYIQ